MIPLLIGLSCFFVAWRALKSTRLAATREWSGPRAAVVVGIVAALTLLQLWVRRDDIARYRFSLVGLRYRLNDERGAPTGTPIRVSGEYDVADLYVSAAGLGDVARLRPDTSDTAVLIEFATDGGAIALVEERLRLGRSRWRIPSAVPMHVGDTVLIRARGEVHRLELRELADTLRLVGTRLPLPWARRHALAKTSAEGADKEIVLPSSGVGFAQRLRGARPSFFARSYPLVDVAAALDTAAVWGLPPLTSFFYYQGDILYLADVDSEVEVVRAGALVPEPVQHLRLARGSANAIRLLIAALPLRDYPELRLTLPERYGIRPLRSFRLTAHGEWLDATFATPEIQSLDRVALRAITLPGAADEDGYRVRISHARDPQIRQAVVFETPSKPFAASSQAVLSLAEDPRSRSYEVVTPAGIATARVGEPIPLGSRDRAILLRVDGQATSFGFWLLHIALFTLAACVFYFRKMPAPIYALAVAAIGFCAIRLLLGVAALLEYPFVQESQQIGLWLLPLMPWAVVIAAEASRRRGIEHVWVHVLYAVALITLTVVLFSDSLAKQVMLSAVPITLLSLALLIGRHGSPLVPIQRRSRTQSALQVRLHTVWAGASRHAWGWSLGLALLLLRMLLDLIGWREGIMLGGTRIAVSVAYTPLTLLALAFVVHRHSSIIRRVHQSLAPRENNGAVVLALADVLAFVIFAFAAVAFWISDFGMLLVGVPGVLVFIALLGARWSMDRGFAANAAFALPLVLFLLVQSAPGVLRPVWRGDAAAEGRMGEWNRNELLLLERGDPHALRRIGQRRSEALAVMRETMRSYTRGNWFGKGFLEGRVSSEIQDTATREHLVSALLASQWGVAGVIGLVLLLVACTLPMGAGAPAAIANAETSRVVYAGAICFGVLYLGGTVLPAPYGALFAILVSGALILTFAARFYAAPGSEVVAEEPAVTFGGSVAALFLLTTVCAGLYMVLANYGLAFFTGKNVYLLGLDSVSDALEGLILLAGAAAAVSASPDVRPALTPVRESARLRLRPASAEPVVGVEP